MQYLQSMIIAQDHSKNKDDQLSRSVVTCLEKDVEDQLRQYVEVVANMFNSNAFHGFDHVSHAFLSTRTLLARLPAPSINGGDDKTFGIYHDKLAQFAVLFASLIHDVDHRGVPNFCLEKEDEKKSSSLKNSKFTKTDPLLRNQ